MNYRLFLWSTVLIASMIVMGIAIRILALEEIPLSESLILRGVSCFALVVIFSRLYSLSLRPRSIKTQLFRALIAGLALSLLAISYKWLTASTVSILTNIDVPLLLVLGSSVGIKTSLRTRVLSLISILFLIWYVANLEEQIQLFYGLASLMTACFLLCFGYFFIKKSMSEENQAITILVPSLAIICYGLLEHAGCNTWATTWTPKLIFVDVLSGVGMFGAYIATMKLYTVTDLASAEFPTLISSIIIQPFEAIFLNVPMQMMYLLPAIGFVMMIYFIINSQKIYTQSEPC